MLPVQCRPADRPGRRSCRPSTIPDPLQRSAKGKGFAVRCPSYPPAKLFDSLFTKDSSRSLATPHNL